MKDCPRRRPSCQIFSGAPSLHYTPSSPEIQILPVAHERALGSSPGLHRGEGELRLSRVGQIPANQSHCRDVNLRIAFIPELRHGESFGVA